MFAEETCTEFTFDNLQSTKLAEFILFRFIRFKQTLRNSFFETDLYWIKHFQHLILRFASISVLKYPVNHCFSIFTWGNLICIDISPMTAFYLKKYLYYIDLILWLNCSRRNSRNLFLRLEPFNKKICWIYFPQYVFFVQKFLPLRYIMDW